MTLGQWAPTPSAIEDISADVLNTLLLSGERAQTEANWSALSEYVDAAFIESNAAIMKTPATAWQRVLANYSTDQLWSLMQVLAVAEEQFLGWEAGADSPVIIINKVVKSRGEKLSREQLQWLRLHSQNRFLPNGPL